MLEYDHIIRFVLCLALLVMLGGCAIGITNQAPNPGGCVGEPARVFC